MKNKLYNHNSNRGVKMSIEKDIIKMNGHLKNLKNMELKL